MVWLTFTRTHTHTHTHTVLHKRQFVCLGILRRINSISVIQPRQFTNPCFLDHYQPVLNQSIILTLEGKSWCYTHNPERQGGKPLLPVLKTLVCRGWGSNPRPPAHLADAVTTRPMRRSYKRQTT